MSGPFSALAVLLANWFPDPSPEFGAKPGPFVAAMVAGFLVAVIGHIIRSRWMTAIGIAVIFLATFVLPLSVYLSKS